MQITWTSVDGAAYQVFYKDSILDPEWIPLAGIIIATGPETSYLDPTSVPAVPGRYYGVAWVEPSTEESPAEEEQPVTEEPSQPPGSQRPKPKG
jgi:hypothetical protein